MGDWAILGGMTGVHRFVHIGAHAFTAGCSLVLQDVPPFVDGGGSADDSTRFKQRRHEASWFSKKANWRCAVLIKPYIAAA